jgi:phosphoglycolate phosphatase
LRPFSKRTAGLLALPGGGLTRPSPPRRRAGRSGGRRPTPAVEGNGATRWPAAVLFDVDGTLADSFAAITAALNRALVEEGFTEQSLRWVQRHVGRGAESLVRDATGPGAARSAVSAVGEYFARYYGEIFLEGTPPVEGALGVVAAVARGTKGKVGVVSNKAAAWCRPWLERWGFSRHVAALAGPDTSGARKPDPAAVVPVLKELDVRPGDALMVGDMTVDVDAGHAVGMRAVAILGVTSTRRELEAAGPVAILDDIRALPAWLKIPCNEEEA